jgi:hypothetical protein
MQLLLQHQQHQLQQLHSMQQQQQMPSPLRSGSLPIRSSPSNRSLSDAGGVGSGASPQNYYAGLLGSAATSTAQPSPQSPKVLSRRTSSYNR